MFFYWRGISADGRTQNNHMKKNNRTFEYLLYAVMTLCAVSLVLVNFVFKDYLSADAVSANEDRLVLLKNSTLYRPRREIRIAVSDERAVIFVNGEASAGKADEDGYLTFEVYAGDVMHIDLTAIPDETVTVFVESTSSGVLLPPQGTKLILQSGIRKIFTVECVKD